MLKCLLPLLVSTQNMWARAAIRELPPAGKLEHVLHDGDLIFTILDNPIFNRVAQATNSWESHVGIVFQHNGTWWVAESKVPRAKWSKLPDFIRRSGRGKFEVYRLKNPLSREKIARVRHAAEQRIGIYYHLGFNYDSSLMYCSKFARLCYLDGGRDLGKITTFGDLVAHNPTMPMAFFRIYFLGKIPWNRRVVTVKSILDDPQLQIVASGASGEIWLRKKLPTQLRQAPH